ncbi:SPOR domain-containing protein [Chitinilyticum aquatile]|uniref:SPOR domain-containing protein n=1 Tax=Chitinilyticum aquatile TaxID=362520 RepID=UPI00041E661C|nr:SPOR domain-containing protein [Chitinilyticum aquatile]
MKWLFIVLLAANAAIFAFARLLPASVPQQNLALREVNASAIRIVSPDEAYTETAQASTVAAEDSNDRIQPTPVPEKAASQPVQNGQLCNIRWQGLTGDQIAAARKNLEDLALQASEKSSPESSKVWVYIPPLDTLEQAKSKAAQLKELGVDDYFIVNDGRRWQNAISLGIYSTREAGERALEEFRAKGVKSAVVRERDDTVRHAEFTAQNVTPEQLTALKRFNSKYRGASIQQLECK